MKDMHLALVTFVSLLGIILVVTTKPAMPPKKEDVKLKTYLAKITL